MLQVHLRKHSRSNRCSFHLFIFINRTWRKKDRCKIILKAISQMASYEIIIIINNDSYSYSTHILYIYNNQYKKPIFIYNHVHSHIYFEMYFIDIVTSISISFYSNYFNSFVILVDLAIKEIMQTQHLIQIIWLPILKDCTGNYVHIR